MPGYTISVENPTDTVLVTTAETVVATLGGCSISAVGRTFRLRGTAQVTTGANTTGVQLRIRQDSLTGTVVHEVNTEQIEAAAGSTEAHEIDADDPTTGDVYNRTYVLTAQLVAATANGNVPYAYLSCQCE